MTKGVFYTVGNAMLLGRRENEMPTIGTVLSLPAKSYHEREHCPNPPCRDGLIESNYRIVAVKTFTAERGDTFDQVLEDRPWEQSVCTAHRNCDDFFDWYALASYLGTHNSSPAVAYLVDVEPVR